MKLDILVIGDPHFKKSNMKDMIKMTEKVLLIAKNKKPDLIVNLGDTLDTHETIHTQPLTQAIEFMRKLKDIAPLILIIGNHDRINNSAFLTEEHPFVSMNEWSNVTVVDRPKIVNIKNHKLLCVPYVYPGRFFEAIDTLPDAFDPMPDMVFCHQEFKGAKMGLIRSEIGDIWDLKKPFCVSGHIHDYDFLQKNLLYVGTPIQNSFAESDNKAIALIRFDKTKSDTVTLERIKLGIGVKKVIRLNAQDAMEMLKTPSKLESQNQDTKIVISGTSSEINSIIRMNETEQLKGAKIVYDTIIPADENRIVSNEPFLVQLLNRCPENLKNTFYSIFSKIN